MAAIYGLEKLKTSNAEEVMNLLSNIYFKLKQKQWDLNKDRTNDEIRVGINKHHGYDVVAIHMTGTVWPEGRENGVKFKHIEFRIINDDNIRLNGETKYETFIPGRATKWIVALIERFEDGTENYHITNRDVMEDLDNAFKLYDLNQNGTLKEAAAFWKTLCDKEDARDANIPCIDPS